MTQPNEPQPPTSPFAPPEPGPNPGAAPTPGAPSPAFGQPAPQPAVPSFIPPTVAAAVAKPPKKGASAGTIAFVAAIVIAGAGLGFAGGRLTAPQATNTRTGGFGNGNFPGLNGSFNPNASGNPGRGGLGGFGGGGISVTGEVTAVANGSITVQTANGGSVTLQVPSTVTYHTQAAGAASDVAVGSKVQISVSRPEFRPDASGQPAASGQPGGNGNGNGPGGFSLTVTDITVLSK